MNMTLKILSVTEAGCLSKSESYALEEVDGVHEEG